MKTIKEQAIDLLEDIYFSIVHEFDLPIQAFDRVNYRDNIEYLKKVAAEQGLQ